MNWEISRLLWLVAVMRFCSATVARRPIRPLGNDGLSLISRSLRVSARVKRISAVAVVAHW
ncbi:hypothetical protein SAMN05421854_101454 [Amycolatopsis rubida]|uniref:Uncharacterized protein n=1 Tax=Amycolatopsis rubida TaxID=112413 RepID=A0A1I5E236_9PSEU|nr:hypothetical protein SAMN05421854_101454 [Amycolatopsis rubida]